MRPVERIALRMMGVENARTDYTVTTTRVPMRDGVELGADLYEPAGQASGTLLVRGPYGRGWAFSLIAAKMYVSRGYRVLFVSSRGTFDSAGTFDPMRDEAADGQDVVAWMREQPWFTGTFATVGGSYLGYTQWALLADPPPELVAAVITVGPHDFSEHFWGSGAFNLDLLQWSDMIVRAKENPPRIPGLSGSNRDLRKVIDALPLADAADAHFHGSAPWYRRAVTRPDLTDPYWDPIRHTAAVERATVPILLLTGWQDIFLTQTIAQYGRLRARGVDVALTVGPWTHIEVIGKGGRDTHPETFDWLDTHLAGRGPSRRRTPVRITVTGAREWRDLESWPPPTTEHVLRLRPGGGLGATTTAGPDSTFVYDPADPTPTVGGPLIADGGVTDDRSMSVRADVLTFTSEPLTQDLEVVGTPEIELAHTTDNPNADLFIRISDVDAKGRSHNVTETYRRLEPGPVQLQLRPTAHRFLAGHRVRVLIAGGSHPQFARNLGTGENPGTGSALKPSRHTITHDGTGNTLRLPVTNP